MQKSFSNLSFAWLFSTGLSSSLNIFSFFWPPGAWCHPFASVSFSVFCLQLYNEIEMDESIAILHKPIE